MYSDIGPKFLQGYVYDFIEGANENEFTKKDTLDGNLVVVTFRAWAHKFRYHAWYGPNLYDTPGPEPVWNPLEEFYEDFLLRHAQWEQDMIVWRADVKYRWKFWYNKSAEMIEGEWYELKHSYIVAEEDGLETLIHKVLNNFSGIKWENYTGVIDMSPFTLRYFYDSNIGKISFNIINVEEDPV